MLLGTTTTRLDFDPAAAEASRRIVADTLTSWGLDRAVETAKSCTSELVTDALRHGRSPLHLLIRHWTDCVQVLVIDGSEGHDGASELGPYGETTVRRRIVHALVGNWSVDSGPAGTAAWFDLETLPSAR